MATDPPRNKSGRGRRDRLALKNIAMVLNRWVMAPLGVVVSDRCFACRAVLARPETLQARQPTGWCGTCRQNIVTAPGGVALERSERTGSRHGSKLGVVPAHVAFEYGPELGALIRKTKYEESPGLLDLWIRAWVSAPAGRGLLAAASEQAPEILVPIPAHPARRRERGFDVTAEWARRLGELHGIPVVAALRRTRQTPPQTGLGRRERANNVLGAFALTDARRTLVGRPRRTRRRRPHHRGRRRGRPPPW